MENETGIELFQNNGIVVKSEIPVSMMTTETLLIELTNRQNADIQRIISEMQILRDQNSTIKAELLQTKEIVTEQFDIIMFRLNFIDRPGFYSATELGELIRPGVSGKRTNIFLRKLGILFLDSNTVKAKYKDSIGRQREYPENMKGGAEYPPIYEYDSTKTLPLIARILVKMGIYEEYSKCLKKKEKDAFIDKMPFYFENTNR